MRTLRRSAILLSTLFLAGCDIAAAPAPQEGTNHRVRPGESLFGIAERAYGNGLEWPRIWEANPWIDEPDRLRTGAIVYVPPRDGSWGDPPSRGTFALDPGTGSFEGNEEVDGAARSADPGESGIDVFRNIANNVSSKTLLGRPLHSVLGVLLGAFLAHAIVQGILVWLAANITFVKDATFKKSMRAVFLTESLTLSTLLALAGIGILVASVGAGGAAASGSALFPSLESLLRSTSGMAVAAVAVLLLYVVLSLRFFPQVFAIPMGRAITLMALAVLIPHLAGMYWIGQHTGLIR
ncbi:MAG: LysM peptidoglycan-binding domain-containing protein [Planctomycetes bacterium]|nr:LysM peptidoglycan-binding domain-containing protein [Planctomycetota bacterium]